MANYKTGAQRYNDKLHLIFSEGRRLNAIHDKGRAIHAKEGHKGEYSSCTTCEKNIAAEEGTRPSAKTKALQKKKGKPVEDRPEYGKQYSLTGGIGKKSIANGNSWAESEVKKKDEKPRTWADLTDKEREYLQDQGHFGPHL